MNWEVVRKTGMKLNKGERVSVLDGQIVIEKEIIERDVTAELAVELVKSKHSDGYYVGIFHPGHRTGDGRKMIAVLGIDENSKYLLRSYGYRFDKVDGGNVSFRVHYSK